MSSVVTYWSGRSHDATLRDDLLSYLRELAKANDTRWDRSELRRSSAAKGIASPSETKDKSYRARSVYLNQTLSGRVLVGKSMLLLDQFGEVNGRSARPIQSSDLTRTETPGATLVVFSRAEEQRYAVQVSAFRMHGIAFRLYDPRQLYSDEDWMSFVFVDAPDLPELDGQIVRAFAHRERVVQDDEWFQNADWTIDTPTVHLRYYLEEWFDLLMTWIKIFFVSDLEYWRDTVLNRYDELKVSVDRLIVSEGREVAKQAVFEYLLECFHEEADRLEEEIDKAT